MPLELEKIVTELEDTVRFNQSLNPQIPQLDTTLTEPTTARLMYHALLTNENLDAIAPNFDSYAPAPSPTLDNLFSDWLAERRRQAIRTVVMDVYNGKKAMGKQREQLSDLAYYDGVGSIADRIIPKGRLVGFEFELLNNNNIEMLLTRVSTQFDTVQNPLTLRLFHTDLEDQLEQFELDVSVPISVLWHDINYTIKYRDFDKNLVGGRYYLVYDENELAGQAINKRLTFGRRPCGSCSRYNLSAYNKISQYTDVRTIFVGQGQRPADVTKMWDVKRMSYTVDTNWGLNFAFTNGCDLTEFFIDRKRVFGDTVSKQLIVDLLTELNNTTRSNVLSEKVKDSARIALTTTRLGGEGAMEKLDVSKQALSLELSDTERNVCAPRHNTKNIKHGSVQTVSGGVRAPFYY